MRVGATLSQKDEGVELRLVACRSRKLSSAKKNYPVHEKEMLALVDTLEEWRHYFLGVVVLVYTEKSALSYLQKNPKPSPRQVRWLEKLQRYDLKISHIPGRSNVAADALSRYPVDAEAQMEGSVLSVIKGGRTRVTMEKSCRGGDPDDVKP